MPKLEREMRLVQEGYKYIRWDGKIGFDKINAVDHKTLSQREELFDPAWQGEKPGVDDGGTFFVFGDHITISWYTAGSVTIIPFENRPRMEDGFPENGFTTMKRIRRETAKIMANQTGLPVEFNLGENFTERVTPQP